MSATIHVVANNANRERDTSLMAERTPKKRRRLPRRKWIILAGVKSLLASALQFTAVECRVLRAVSAQEPSETDGNKGKYLHSSKVVSKVVSVRSVRGWTTPKRGCTWAETATSIKYIIVTFCLFILFVWFLFFFFAMYFNHCIKAKVRTHQVQAMFGE